MEVGLCDFKFASLQLFIHLFWFICAAIFPFKKHFCSQWLDIKAMVQRQNDPCPLVFRTPDADRFFPMIRIGLRCCTPACIVMRQRFGAAGGESGSSRKCKLDGGSCFVFNFHLYLGKITILTHIFQVA